MPVSRMRTFVAVCLLFSLLTLSAPITLSASTPSHDIVLRIQTPKYTLTPASVTVAGYGVALAPGHPQLPVHGELVPLPFDGDWELIVEPLGSRILAERVDLAPAPGPLTDVESARRWIEGGPDQQPSVPPTLTARDPKVYGVNAFYPASPVVEGQVLQRGDQRLLQLRFYPFQYNPVTGELRYHPEIVARVRPRSGQSESPLRADSVAAAASPAAGESTVRIRTGAAGMYRLTYDELRNAGVPDGVATNTFVMRYLGSPVDIRISDADGLFSAGDLVIFYAEGHRSRYTDQNVYFLSYGAQASTDRIAERQTAPAPAQTARNWAIATARVEYDEAYFSAYPLPATADHFFDSPTLQASASVPSTTIAYDLNLPNALTTGNVSVRGQFYGGKAQSANPDQSVRLYLNAHDLGAFTWDGQVGYVAATTAPASYLDGAPNQLKVETSQSQLPGLADYLVYADWMEVSYPAALVANADRLPVDDLALAGETSVEVIAAGFSTPSAQVYDIRDARHPVRITGAEATQANGVYEVRFRDAWGASDPAPRYYLATDAALLAPLKVEPAGGPAWNTPDNHYDYIAIVHRSLWDAVQPLLDKRAAEGFRVAKVDVQHIYDLYSNGRLDPEAIRSFLTYAYFNWNGAGARPAYVLLVGDGHYDFKGALKVPQAVLIPPYLANVDPWIGETAADNRFVSVNGPDDFVPEMAVGRIPAQTPADVTAAVNKIVRYEDPAQAPSGAWQNMVTFVADQNDDPSGAFQDISENMRLNWLPDSYNSQTLYWETDYQTVEAMYTAIGEALPESVMMQWFGHASKFFWGTAFVYGTIDVPNAPIASNWPISVDYSCWTGYFVNLYNYYGYRTLSEALLLTADKGSAAVIGPSGQHLGSALTVLNEGILKSVFTDRIPRIGDALDAAKSYYLTNSTGSEDVVDTTILFGDPAMKVRLPAAAAPPEPPAVTIAHGAASGAIDLSWLDLEPNTSYQVWRADIPYFEPETGGSQVGSVDATLYATGATVTFTDDGTAPPPVTVTGDPVHNYFWLVRGVNTSGVSPNSNRVGEFDFALTTGAP